jgi:hypothetical protein
MKDINMKLGKLDYHNKAQFLDTWYYHESIIVKSYVPYDIELLSKLHI